MRTQVVAGRWPSLSFSHDVGGGVIQPPVAPPSGDFPNQPAGWTVQVDTPFSLLAAGQNFGVPIWESTNNSQWRLNDSLDQARLSIVDASTGVRTDRSGGTTAGSVLGTSGMMSSPYAFSGVFPTTASKGGAPWNMNPAILTGFSKIYIGMLMMLSTNFSAKGVTGIKHLWPQIDTPGDQPLFGNNTYTGWDDSANAPAGVDLNYGFFQQGPVTRDQLANMGGAAIASANWSNHLGVWRQLEQRYEANTNDATANGIAKIWHDGLLTHNFSDVQWQSDPAGLTPRVWNHVEFACTWGGDLGGPYPAADMYLYVDRMVIAGSN